jgi:hypothetical protein
MVICAMKERGEGSTENEEEGYYLNGVLKEDLSEKVN